jgi:hypothetical protein
VGEKFYDGNRGNFTFIEAFVIYIFAVTGFIHPTCLLPVFFYCCALELSFVHKMKSVYIMPRIFVIFLHEVVNVHFY